ncbi:hypothetical protein NE237_002655 [Protea cynaroides]|uniref:Uncharacterized protein n=1 Tax=Protea cynaroides TaxID=273540 RepID=A0A9Q0GKV6_9MAGN|nr:hypothetical protein NE237_002655 [Protea cynaroides]
MIFRHCQEWEKCFLNEQPLEPIETFYDLTDDDILAWLVSKEYESDEPEGPKEKKDSGAHQLGPTSGAHIADSKRNQLQLEQPRGKDMKDGGVTSIELWK